MLNYNNICPKCGYENLSFARYCYKCGCVLIRDSKKSTNTLNDADHVFRRSAEAAGMAEGVSYFERYSQHDKYRTMQGHGFAAEDANALNDVLHGRSVDKTGLDNSLNGPDRVVNGVSIQVKYCKTPHDTVNSLFNTQGEYRYGGMKIEVPKGQGDEVRALLREKARLGQVKDQNGNVITDLNTLTSRDFDP